jgi:membrane fusion protein (multidrug efflux system)
MNRQCKVLIIAGIILTGCSTDAKKNSTTQSDSTTAAGGQVLAIEGVVATQSSFVDTIISSAPVSGFTDVTIVSRSSGTITSTPAKLGQQIKVGQLLVAVDGAVQQAALAQAAVAVDQAQLGYDVATQLFDKGNSSKAELIGAKTGLSAAKAGMAMAQLNADYTKTFSSVAGVVTFADPSVQPGGTITAGMPLVRIVDISKLKITLQIGENEIGRIRSGQKALINVPSVNVLLNGVVAAVSASTASGSGSFAVEIHAPNTPDRMVRAGMGATVSIVTGTTYEGIIVPSKCVDTRSGIDYVWIVRGGSVDKIGIDAERISNGRVLLRGKISANDTLAISGLSKLVEKAKVAVTVR